MEKNGGKKNHANTSDSKAHNKTKCDFLLKKETSHSATLSVIKEKKSVWIKNKDEGVGTFMML